MIMISVRVMIYNEWKYSLITIHINSLIIKMQAIPFIKYHSDRGFVITSESEQMLR